jgi:hypothetical protein
MKRFLLIIFFAMASLVATSCVTLPTHTYSSGQDTVITVWNRTPTAFGIYVDERGANNGNAVVFAGQIYKIRVYPGSHKISVWDLGADANGPTGGSVSKVIAFASGNYGCRISSGERGFDLVFWKK